MSATNGERQDHQPSSSRQLPYRITVRGVGPAAVEDWSGVFAVVEGDGTTTFLAQVDQAALRGLLCRLWDLNATLVVAEWAP